MNSKLNKATKQAGEVYYQPKVNQTPINGSVISNNNFVNSLSGYQTTQQPSAEFNDPKYSLKMPSVVLPVQNNGQHTQMSWQTPSSQIKYVDPSEIKQNVNVNSRYYSFKSTNSTIEGEISQNTETITNTTNSNSETNADNNVKKSIVTEGENKLNEKQEEKKEKKLRVQQPHNMPEQPRYNSPQEEVEALKKEVYGVANYDMTPVRNDPNFSPENIAKILKIGRILFLEEMMKKHQK